MKPLYALRTLILAEVVFGCGAVAVDLSLQRFLPRPLQACAIEAASPLHGVPYLTPVLGVILLVGMVTGWIGLWRLWAPARIIYTVSWALGLLHTLIQGASFWTPAGTTLKDLSTLSAGGILALIFFSELRSQFGKARSAVPPPLPATSGHASDPGEPPKAVAPVKIRYAIVTMVVALWMAIGWLFHLDPNSYLLVGVPILIAFQLGVARRPLAQLWLKSAQGFRLPWWGWLIAAAFAAYPAYMLVAGWPRFSWAYRLWFICAVTGAVPLAYTICHFSRRAARPFLLCWATAGVLGTAMMFLTAWLVHKHPVGLTPSMISSVLEQYLLYFPVCYILEEVFFRGALDSFLHDAGDGHPWLSATFISSIWGLWHLPTVPLHHAMELATLAVVLPLIHCIYGIPFSLGWRKGGNLLIPASVHAFLDSLRNAVMR